MTNKQRFLEAQSAYNRRMTNRRSRARRSIVVRILFFAGAGLGLALLVCNSFPELRYQTESIVGRIFSVFGIQL